MSSWSGLRWLPWLLWAATAIGSAALWCGIQRIHAAGYVVSVEYTVAAPRAGRVDELLVEVGDRVRAGDRVATLDGAEIDAELAILAAERQKLQAQLGAARVAAESRESATTRELDQGVSSAELSLRAAQARRKVKAAELAAIGGQVRRLRDLVDQRLADRRELDALLIQQTSTSREVEATDSLISQMVGEVASARGRRGAVAVDAPELSVEPLRAELTILERREDLLRLRRAELDLFAPSDGEVRAILVRPGEVVTVGAPVLTLVGGGGPRVQVCTTETGADAVTIGEAALLYPRGRDEPLHGRVSALGDHVGQLPSRCWRDPQMPEWGREITVEIDDGVPLLAGQSLRVSFQGTPAPPPSAAPKRPRTTAAPRRPRPTQTAATPHATDPADPAAPTADAPAPRAMLVPAAIADRSRLEPSGLVWSTRRERFILVSDDTGTPTADEHAPWLFTMTRAGAIDPEPLQLTGVDAVSDLEAIAPGPGDSLYILASQSLSRKGKRPPARQLLARVTLDARGGEVVEAVHLADLLAAAGPALQQSLGVADLADLDIEGMTASAGGALLLGLKAPLGARGEALLWRLGRPDRLLAGEGLAAAELALWGSTPLRVQADGAEVPGGVADLLELADGSLVIAATAAGIDPVEQSGSLWHVPGRARLSAPRLLHTFDGLKPEGVALAPDGAALIVVFDTGDATPQWTELPWPAR